MECIAKLPQNLYMVLVRHVTEESPDLLSLDPDVDSSQASESAQI